MMTTVEKLQQMLKLEPVKDGETGVYLGLKISFGSESVTMNMDAALHFLDALSEAMGLQQEPPAVMELSESDVSQGAEGDLGVEGVVVKDCYVENTGGLLGRVGGVLVEDNPQPVGVHEDDPGLAEVLNEIKEEAAPPPEQPPVADGLDVVD